MKRNVCLAQVNYKYGSNVFLPYSVGLIQAYCQSLPQIRDNFSFLDFIYLREDPDRIAEGLDSPKIAGVSCYLWNWEWSKALAKSIKAHHPECLVVLGGPQIPIKAQDFFHQHPYADLLVHYEGEVTFSEILLESLKETPDYLQIKGISVRLEGNTCYQGAPGERIGNPDSVPSPYLSGCFDQLVKESSGFHASQETHRGCPYACTFCDWGSAVFTKVRPFGDSRLEQELEWFGENRIELLYNCDANYGLLNRDLDLTRKLADTKQRLGFPKQFRAAYAKNSNLKIFEIGKLLNEAQMSKGVTLSFQSLDDNTLSVIKRKNIKVQNFRELVKLYRQNHIPTYTELIMGLPGETHESFLDGIDGLLEAGQHDGIHIYVCIVLTNSEMGDPAYIERHGIKTVTAPALLQHSTSSDDPVAEYNRIIIGTESLPQQDYKRVFLFSWAIQAFHSLGLTQFLSIFFRFQFGLGYRAFYQEMMDFAESNPETLLWTEYHRALDSVENAMSGRTWGVVSPKYGDIIWPVEEACFLNLVCDKDRFYREVSLFLEGLASRHGWVIEHELLDNLLVYQKNMIVDPYSSGNIGLDLEYNLHEYFETALPDSEPSLIKFPSPLTIIPDKCFFGDLQLYAREVVWYGRKGGKFLHSNVKDEEIETVQPEVH